MQKLEKILAEIDIKIAGSMGKKREGLLEAREIIRKHMNDGWIPVEERLPEDGETVLCTDGKDVYLVEYDADYDAPFGDVDGITHWCYCPEAYQAKQIAAQRPEWKDRMLHTFLGGHT